VVETHGLAGKPLWVCCGQLVLESLRHLPACSAAAGLPTAAEGGGLALVVPAGSAAAGMQGVDSLEDGLLSCLAHCCSGE
jgi:hypothetical protein